MAGLNLGEILSYYDFKDYFLSFLSLASPFGIPITHVTNFVVIPTVLGYAVLLGFCICMSLFSLFFTFGIFYCHILECSGPFLDGFLPTNEFIKGILHFWYSVFHL